MQMPSLRQDLTLYDGPSDANGQPTWTLHDPARDKYFQLDWPTFEVLSRWFMGQAEAIVQAIAQDTTLRLSNSDVERVREFLIRGELIEVRDARQVQTLAKSCEQQQQHWAKKMLHVYLFFRVPLVRPDAQLGRVLPLLRWLGSPFFTGLTVLVALLGLFQISRQWGTYSATLVDMLNPTGYLFFGLTLIGVKVAHELGHALVAKSHGCRVPRMGVAFLVFFPVAYTDVNDAWKLNDRKARIQIDAAGIRVELALAAWFSLLWSVLPEGNLKTAAYLISSTTWISTLLVNASPFLRFDGYFILMDSLNLPNLHPRSFALGRWVVASRLLGLHGDKPESLKPGTERFLVVFAWATWLYRLSLFTGIAWMIFVTIPKPLGPFLAGVELYWFIIKPVHKHLLEWWRQYQRQRADGASKPPQIKRWQWAMVGLVLFLVVPWDTRIQGVGLIKPQVIEQFHLPGQAQLTQLQTDPPRRWVKQGELLMRFESDQLDQELLATQSRLKQLDHQIENIRLTQLETDKLSLLLAERQEHQTRLEAVQTGQNGYEWRAAKAGYFYPVDIDLRAGDWVGKNVLLGAVYEAHAPEVYAYVTAGERARLQAGHTGRFYADYGGFESLDVEVLAISQERVVNLDEAILASQEGGRITSRQQGKHWVPEQVLYKVQLQLSEVPKGWRPDLKVSGRVHLSGHAQSWLGQSFRNTLAFIEREAGL